MTSPTVTSPSLDDLIARMLEWKKPARTLREAKPQSKVSAPPAKAPEPIAPGAWRHSSRWKNETLVVVVQTVVCDNCSAHDTSSQPFVYVERYHPLYGRHLEALSPSSPRHGELPRALREVESRVMYCRHCFLTSPCAAAQPRLFPDAHCATFEVKGQLTLTDIFGTAQARTVEVTGTISPAGTSPDRGALPAALPYFPLVITAQRADKE